jgi:hypothetical protein
MYSARNLSNSQFFHHKTHKNCPGICDDRPATYLVNHSRIQLKCDGTRWHTGGEVNGKLANGVVIPVLFTLPRNMVYPALLPLPRLPVVVWTDAPCRFKWTLPFFRKTKSGSCACAITFQLASNTPHIVFSTYTHYFTRISIEWTGNITFGTATGTRGDAVGWGTAQQTRRSQVQFPMMPMEFFIYIILPTALWPWDWLSF